MKALMRFVVVTLATICIGNAHASTNSSEITDMWWNPAEAGWGVNIVLQNNVAFMTFFVYDAVENPVWYTSDVHFQGNNGGALVWAGNLYATKGPWFGGPFASNVTTRPAGTVTFTLLTLNQAALTYSVDGVTVTKSVQRQTWSNEDYTGTYAGGYSVRYSACSPPSLNGVVEEAVGSISVNQNASSISFDISNGSNRCTFAGTYEQVGKLGQVLGNYSCVNGVGGTFSAVEMTPTISGFTARVSGQNQYCQWSGYLGGIARAH